MVTQDRQLESHKAQVPELLYSPTGHVDKHLDPERR